MYDAIFLTTPSGLFADVSEAHHRARALYDYIKRFCNNNNITNTTVDISVSNVNPRKAHYIYQNRGVGRPQKVLVGDLENCFVPTHLHMIVEGEHKSFIANLIINYFKKRYKSLKSPKYGVRIWKKYILKCDLERVRKYIWIQSLHYLTVNEMKNENKKKKIIKVRVKKPSYINKNTVSQENYYNNQTILYNLRFQWLLIEKFKNIAYYIVNYELFDKLVVLQQKIKMYGGMINLKVDVAAYYSDEIANIAIELENLRQYTNTEKQRYDYFVVQA